MFLVWFFFFLNSWTFSMVLWAFGSLFHHFGPAQLKDLAAKVLSFVLVQPIFSPDVDSLVPIFSLHTDILLEVCSNILELQMITTYGLVSKFCILSFYELEANVTLLKCFWSCCPSWPHHLRQPFLLQCSEYIAFWICPHLEDQQVCYCSSLDVTLLSLEPEFLLHPGLINAWCSWFAEW